MVLRCSGGSTGGRLLLKQVKIEKQEVVGLICGSPTVEVFTPQEGNWKMRKTGPVLKCGNWESIRE